MTSTGRLTLLDVEETLQQMVVPNYGIQASNDSNFLAAFFGRDTRYFCRDILQSHPSLAKLGLWSLARLQARQPQEDNPQQDARVGSIPHEYRPLYINGEKIGPEQEARFRRLGGFWGINNEQVIYYGAMDATCDFVTYVCQYCQTYGNNILEETFKHALTGEVRTYQASLLDAIAWILRQIETSELGLVENIRTNRKGQPTQAWRDGRISYIHPDGTVFTRHPDFHFASLDVQCKAFRALMIASETLASRMPIHTWKTTASTLQERILSAFFMPEHNFFGMGIDRDPATGKPRLIRTMSSLPAEILETGIFDDLSDAEQRRYMEMILPPMYSSAFLTPIGFRCLSLDYAPLFGYYPYQGPQAVWHVSSNTIAIGERLCGFPGLAEDLENRMLNGNTLTGFFSEFMIVTDDGKVFVDIQNIDHKGATNPATFLATNRPERNQAWTVSAVQRVNTTRSQPQSPATGWRRDLENDLLNTVGGITPIILDRQTLLQQLPVVYGTIDVERGRQAEAEYIRTHTEEGGGQL